MRPYRGLVAALVAAALGWAPAMAGAPGARAALPDLAAISFATPDVGWAVGPGLIWRTNDGARTWRVQYTGRADLYGVDAVSPSVAYAWGGRALWRTVDGGRIWHPLRVPGAPGPHMAVLSLSAAGRRVAYVALGSTVVTAASAFVTRDGGRTWTSLRIPLPLGQLAFTSPSDGWAVTRLGADVYRTVDGGRKWSRSFAAPGPTFPPAPLSGVLATAGRHGAYLLLIGASGMTQTSYSVYHTANGAHWTPVVAVSTAGAGPAPGNPHGVSSGPVVPGGLGLSPGPIAATGGVAVLVGVCRACDDPTADVVRSTDGGHIWSRPVRLALSEGMPTFADLSLASPQVGYLAVPPYFPNGRTAVFATRDGGRTWRIVWRSSR